MVTKPRIDVDELVQETPEYFRVSRRVYTDPGIFEAEMERIFERSWLYVGHATECPNGGDYKTVTLAGQPVIMTRNPDNNQIYVLFNRCRHRGTTVCQLEFGNSTYFRCGYHGWVYNNKGDIIGVPGRDGYGRSVDMANLGLEPLPRVDEYKGFIFASLRPEGQPLEEHLGNARLGLDFIIGDGQIKASRGLHKFGFNGNWKLQLENTVDGYHFPVVHKSQIGIWARRSGEDLESQFDPDRGGRGLDLSRVRDLGNGHAVHIDDPYDPDYQVPPFGLNFNLGIFPNLDILALEQRMLVHLRIINPVAVDRTEVILQPLLKTNLTAEDNFQRLRGYEEFYGPSSFGSTDDWEIFARVQKGLQAKREEWVLFSRGLETEEIDERGIRTNRVGQGEASQRSIHRHWKRVMAVE